MEAIIDWSKSGGEIIAAGITLAVAIVIAFVVDRFAIAHAARAATRGGVMVSRAAQTRMRLVRRLVFVAIVVIGIALALLQFNKIEKLAAGILASTAVLGIVLGFAARQVLANPVAGILLAITQPIRIGDTIEIEDTSGRVDDLTLSYTFIDTHDGRLMVIPNEKVVTTVLFNRSTGNRAAPPAASVWVPLHADLRRARAVLERNREVASVSVAEVTAEGVRLELHGRSDPTRTVMGQEEAKLREYAHQALREADLLD